MLGVQAVGDPPDQGGISAQNPNAGPHLSGRVLLAHEVPGRGGTTAGAVRQKFDHHGAAPPIRRSSAAISASCVSSRIEGGVAPALSARAIWLTLPPTLPSAASTCGDDCPGRSRRRRGTAEPTRDLTQSDRVRPSAAAAARHAASSSGDSRRLVVVVRVAAGESVTASLGCRGQGGR